MKKIPTLFRRDPNDMRHVTSEIHPDCQWVLDGEGVATRKYDGTCVMLDEDGNWWARREVKPGKISPPHWRFVSHDDTTGKSMGWEPVEQSSFGKAFADCETAGFQPGTYELCGPKVNGNPEGFESHTLVRHADVEEVWFPLEPDADLIAHTVRRLGAEGIEGVVWHHPDGRMAKLKARDLTTPAAHPRRETEVNGEG